TASYMLFFPSIILSTLYGSGNASVALCLLMALYIRSANLPNEWVNITFFIFSAITIKLLTTRLMREKARAGQALANLEQEKKERDHFVASLTHDLQTPLTAAKLHAEMLFRNIEPD